ncbi:transcriptional antiterminator/beta-glucoside operon transcriptional antiterminator [Bacillus mesophilus]|uniref:Transcription antiterminator n=1 Tax=Bacillus mesophilus TaxID=1808955 RepID=A0A6M0QAR9_9BACI|nr:transcription antiterminator [Bacillus mesophilus]MBM7661991.1 transcriptional antiterminator/beta-glucoside operon transcriptional antiterminator [Bacillus mesophilus]NEY72650.1 transcription antiterminator [Bacillus mesophilus]
MGSSYTVKKVLNNNVIIANSLPGKDEVVLIGKGIGFNKSKGNSIDVSPIEKLFVLTSEKEQDQYKKLLPYVSEEIIECMNDVIHFITVSIRKKLNQQLLISLTDHISFAIKRLQEGLEIKNPFSLETKTLYPEEYSVATEVVQMINEKLEVSFPEGEIGFIALHIHSAVSDRRLSEVNQHSQLIHKLVEVIEDSLKTNLDREGVQYVRLVSHIRFMLDRVRSEENVGISTNLSNILQAEYPVCYNLAWKLIKIVQQQLKVKVFEAEAVYLTLHLQRLSAKNQEITS